MAAALSVHSIWRRQLIALGNYRHVPGEEQILNERPSLLKITLFLTENNSVWIEIIE